MKKALIFGAGLVAKPITRYLLEQPEIEVLVASRTVSKAENLINGHPKGKAIAFDISKDVDKLPELISEADIAISLLPYTYHVAIAEECIRQKTHMVTTSYVSDSMRALDEKAKKTEIILLNEIGVDPGIDHMSAQKIIDSVHENGGKIDSFKSYCGGLPAPEANTNPYGYKLSWSPRGVLMASRNSACFLEDEKQVDIPGEDLFGQKETMLIEGLGDFETYPNRNSMPYIDLYGIAEVKTMFRGTIRNLGWCDTLLAIGKLGFLDDDPQDKQSFENITYSDFLRKMIDLKLGIDIKQGVADKLQLEKDSEVIERIEWLSLLSDDPITINEGTPLDLVAARFMEKLGYEERERDMLILIHKFIASYPDRKEQITSTLIDYGLQDSTGDSSMSRTVSLPAAIATKLILEDKITIKGVQIPTLKEIYDPVLKELEDLNIVFKENVIPL